MVFAGKYTIPEGATVALSIYCLHRDPKYFPNPNTFDPERFNSDNNTGRHPFAYVPFAAGVRNCIGKLLAGYYRCVVTLDVAILQIQHVRVVYAESTNSGGK